ncbi:Phosphoadenosine phosphosulfate reductase [Roseovarius litorisediminis]|uniref:Adenosine 5'-phosphosulfate reductase n=1 Tax=Roseovarius litorisediminis TaxID=1312363 RepID=A0A1Y5TJ74_9RHOB|nr:phosphoadenylyl-sulfate reductase [Roseovarius litorisediminis]SLN61621.1 Phosphoadenosine phosphosulfate reductase [Roseovarius litorisediminis]
MPHNDLTNRVRALNERYRHHSATSVLQHALSDPEAGKLALVSSFGAESVVLLHMVSVLQRDTPVIFIDTEMLFTETLVYQQELSERLGLSDLRILHASQYSLKAADPGNDLHLKDPDACCTLRKTLPLQAALHSFDGWITGRKRYQGSTRAELEFFELEAGTHRIKVNPLAHWAPEDMRTYMEENRLPRHPLVSRGYPSIGCMPCTTAVKPGEDPRAGRWRDSEKTECGIHFANGKMVRKGVNA